MLKDATGVQTLILTPTGISGTVILDEDSFISNSATKVPTQQSVRVYVDTQDANLQDQIDLFSNSNHGHVNLPLLEETGLTQIITTDLEIEHGYHYLVVATTEVLNISLPTLVTKENFFITNSLDSTFNIQVLNPSYTIKGSISTVPAGTDIILEPGDSIVLVATSGTTMEVI